MQEYKRITITKEEVIPLAEKMRADGVTLAMIHAHFEDDGKPVVCYEYQVGTGIESYAVEGESVLPDISPIYDLGAEWPEREINELMGLVFEGLDTSERLFLPDTMFEGQGHILVTPMDKLIREAHGEVDAQ
ncbi:MAG: NADH-quinone oxidoreductase subunit C [Lachnospiraceae bacterium]|nr:NADH-quinone oxidoreductase subunit C [Lachnospiraceae bacterium]